jgi:hypothetical protein
VTAIVSEDNTGGRVGAGDNEREDGDVGEGVLSNEGR